MDINLKVAPVPFKVNQTAAGNLAQESLIEDTKKPSSQVHQRHPMHLPVGSAPEDIAGCNLDYTTIAIGKVNGHPTLSQSDCPFYTS